MKIAQWKKGDLLGLDYCSTISSELEKYNENNCIVIKIKNDSFKAQKCYSFKKLVLNNLLSRPINIKLMNKLSDSSNYQTLKKIQNVNKIELIDFTFIPKRDFEYLVFEYIYGEEINVTANSMREVINIYEKIDSPHITSLGIQGVSGLKFVINGNVIQMGKSRLYTVSDVDIDFIGFIIEKKENDNDDKEGQTIPVPLNRADNYFIMDYQYEDEEV